MSPERRRRYFGSVSRRTKREKIETLETAPPVIASEELPKELMAKISQKAASHHGGIVKPSIPESVTIPYDSKEVH
ncbi:hypothetical protein GCK32_015276 [Trichostrongylus colubriformis]|uniref:Uncharacterized protein n=1 Tax=Trichostrongylus colubriformis TaxID=6319 RepID=A0AAN8FPD1_TRICO